MKKYFLLTVLFLCVTAGMNAQVDDGDVFGAEIPPALYFTEEMPEFPGGMEALNSFLAKEIQYPEAARTNAIQGIVLVEFVVEEDGSISSPKIKVSLSPECDKEAVRCIMAMPKWKPARNCGKTARCYYQIPVTFRM